MKEAVGQSATFHASEVLQAATASLGVRLPDLVAAAALWAHPDVHRRLVKATGSAVWFPDTRRAHPPHEKRGSRSGNILLDDNTYANTAIKLAIGGAVRAFRGFEACHLWPLSCYDEQCHTAIANLVLLPRALAGLSDHDSEVVAILQYRSWELFGWHPSKAHPPLKPEHYPEEQVWRPVAPPCSTARSALERRLRRK